MIQLKITNSIAYSLQTLIRESGYIARLCWPWLPLVILLGWADEYILHWSRYADLTLYNLICTGTSGLGQSFCNLYRTNWVLTITHNAIPVMLYVALLRYFILQEDTKFFKPEIRLERLYHTKVIPLGSYYFSFKTRELTYLLLILVSYTIISIILQAATIYVFNLSMSNDWEQYRTTLERMPNLIGVYGNSLLSTAFYTLLSLIYADIAINGFTAFKNIPSRIVRLRGNFIALFVIIFVLYLPFDLLQIFRNLILPKGSDASILSFTYYAISQSVYYIAQFASLIIIAKLYVKLYNPQTEVSTAQAS